MKEKIRIPNEMILALRFKDIHVMPDGSQRWNSGRVLSEERLMEIYREYKAGGDLDSYLKKDLEKRK